MYKPAGFRIRRIICKKQSNKSLFFSSGAAISVQDEAAVFYLKRFIAKHAGKSVIEAMSDYTNVYGHITFAAMTIFQIAVKI